MAKFLSYRNSYPVVVLYLFLTLFAGRFCFCHRNDADILRSIVEESTKDFILCRDCGADLTDSSNIINQLSPEASIVTNQTLFGREGVEVQLVKNPLGLQYIVITTSTANCVGKSYNWNTYFFLFPGYAWKPCLCRHCGKQLGWMFEPISSATKERSIPSKRGFYVLFLYQLLSEVFADSLIVVPKSYKN